MPERTRLRPAVAADASFLEKLYASTRMAELSAAPWSPAQKTAFLRSQYEARRKAYALQYPGAEVSVVAHHRGPIGALIVDRSADAIRLVDIALAPEHRDKGLGTALIRALMTEAQASRRPLCLQVLHDNPARRLYARLGFNPAKNCGERMELVWQAPNASPGALRTENLGSQ